MSTRPPRRPADASRPPVDPPGAAEPYGAYDPIPVPDAVEKNTETSWALFEEIEQRENARYADTVPMTRPGELYRDPKEPGVGMPPVKIRPAAPTPSSVLEKMLQEARRGNRVCPRPEQWEVLHARLKATASAAAVGSLTSPLTGPAWSSTSSLAKRMAFKDHMEWAAVHGQGALVLSFLKGLPEDQWHHMGE